MACGEIDLYELGIVLQHNPEAIPHAGSAIFIHLWRGEKRGTAGCIAMSRPHLKSLLEWLDREKEPKIVQLPVEVYREKREAWNLPVIDIK
jgi:L,D-peptidoglycan transpeptidase YkuD (ErfK/YbiS/YcfS/YnhG family)